MLAYLIPQWLSLVLMMTRTTIHDIAVKTGYSTATVSMALRNRGRLPDTTRKKIQQIARQMDYRPDPVLASMAASRWHGHRSMASATVALISDKREFEGQAGLIKQADHLGYRVHKFIISDYVDGRRLSDILYNRGIMGVAIAQIFTPGFCESFDWPHFATVGISEGAFRPPVHLIMPNHFRAVQGAWDYAVARGFKRIGMMLFDMPYALDFHDRRAAFVDRQSDLPTRLRIPMLTIQPEESVTNPDTLLRTRKWLDRYQPECILGFNDIFWWLLRNAGWRELFNPESFVSLWKSSTMPNCPGYLLSHDGIGNRAADWLDSLLRTGERGLPKNPATMEIEMEWEDVDRAAHTAICLPELRR